MIPSNGGANDVALGILVMALITVGMRWVGFWLMGYIPVTPTVRRMLDALPGSVIMAAVLPIIVTGGLVPALAIVAALGAMIVIRNDFLAVLAGMGVAAGLRALGV